MHYSVILNRHHYTLSPWRKEVFLGGFDSWRRFQCRLGCRLVDAWLRVGSIVIWGLLANQVESWESSLSRKTHVASLLSLGSQKLSIESRARRKEKWIGECRTAGGKINQFHSSDLLELFTWGIRLAKSVRGLTGPNKTAVEGSHSSLYLQSKDLV